MRPSTKHRTIVQCLLELDRCTTRGARFVQASGDAPFYPYRDVLDRALRAAGLLQQRGVRVGDRIAIMLPTSIQFFDAFLGAQLAGAIPAAVYPPLRLGKLGEYFARTRQMLEKIGASQLITDRRIREIVGPAVEHVDGLEGVLDAADLAGAARGTAAEVDPGAPAFLQFSSGTTVEPKAVMVSHVNLLSNLEMIDGYFKNLSEAEVDQGGVCWLPLYHDMGLVGNLFIGVYHPGTVTYIPPELFIARPRVWLQTISRYRGVVSAAPDFAYGLCVSKIKDEHMDGVDLSSWRIALNGAEPIDPNRMRTFAERFARWGFRPEAMTPVYGLAEAGLAVSFSDPTTPPLVTEFDRQRLSERGEAARGPGRRLPSAGRPMPGLSVEIHDDLGRALPEGRVGRIMARGPSITRGYYRDHELSARTIRDGWLNTGDLGFLFEGHLYIAGREKDLIIIRGRNYAPQEIEVLLDDLIGVRRGCVVAVGHAIEDQGEQLVLLVERDPARPRPDVELEAEISRRVLDGIALAPHRIRLLAPGTLPRTSSGKLRRAEALRLHLAAELAAPLRVGPARILTAIGRSKLAWGRFWLRKATRRLTSPAPLDDAPPSS